MRVGLIFGGRSGEHEVSIVSARAVRNALEERSHDVVPMAIDRRGLWAGAEVSAEVLDRSGDRTDSVVPFEGMDRLAPSLLGGQLDVAFPVLHGPYGEDGTIQGLLETLGVPYVGCGVAASAVCMDKALTKRLLAAAGLDTPDWIELSRHEFRAGSGTVAGACTGLGFPLFVKPARLGSSVGISKVETPDGVVAALEEAFRHDTLVVVERGVDAQEIEVPVIGNHEPRAAVPGEVVPGHAFYDYADKYLDDACRLLVPAPLDHEERERAETLAVAAYRSLGCEGMARVDLFLERGTGRYLVNEVNTIPGFTPISMFPKLWEASGLPYAALVERLLELALERHRERAG